MAQWSCVVPIQSPVKLQTFIWVQASSSESQVKSSERSAVGVIEPVWPWDPTVKSSKMCGRGVRTCQALRSNSQVFREICGRGFWNLSGLEIKQPRKTSQVQFKKFRFGLFWQQFDYKFWKLKLYPVLMIIAFCHWGLVQHMPPLSIRGFNDFFH